jgi:diadenosine tetraphosphatase ApaH/serine/threonine PP2A family protein phosphatase
VDVDPLKKLVRAVLLVLVALASAGAAWLGVAGLLGWMAVGALLALGLGTLRTLPGGSRAAGWLFAVWLGLSLVLVGTADEVVARVDLGRAELAVGGSVTFLVLACLAVWSCTHGGEEPGER